MSLRHDFDGVHCPLGESIEIIVAICIDRYFQDPNQLFTTIQVGSSPRNEEDPQRKDRAYIVDPLSCSDYTQHMDKRYFPVLELSSDGAPTTTSFVCSALLTPSLRATRR